MHIQKSKTQIHVQRERESKREMILHHIRLHTSNVYIVYIKKSRPMEQRTKSVFINDYYYMDNIQS